MKHLTVEQLIKQLQKFPKDATVRIYHETLCPDADFYVVKTDHQEHNAANEVELFLEQES